MTQQIIVDAQDTISEYLIERLMEREQIEADAAIEELISTRTYELLQDQESAQYTKSPEYVWTKLLQELEGDMKSWMKE